MAHQDRDQHIRWQELHMGIALLAAERCKDPAEKSGACIVNHNVFSDIPQGDMSKNAGNVVGVGYYGRPVGIKSELISARESDCHAVMNAIAFKASDDIRGCTMFVTKFPCVNCAKFMVELGITEVIYLGKIEPQHAMEIWQLGIKANFFRPFRVQRSSITVNFE